MMSIEYQTPFCSQCLTEDSGGSWWPNGSPKGVYCQHCWEEFCAREWWKMIDAISPLMNKPNHQ